MRIFLTSCVLLVVALLLHVGVWRIRLPKHHTRTLLSLFAMVLCAWVVFAHFGGLKLHEIAHVTLYYVSLSLSYVITYSAIEGDSPTLNLMRLLAQQGESGMSHDEIRAFFEARPFVQARLNALLRDGLVREQNGRYFAAGTGSPFFRLILSFRKLYGSIEQGG